jgi:hypothetical protein
MRLVASMTTEHEYSMGDEFDELDAETQAVVRRVVEKARTEAAWRELFRTGDVYAYKHASGNIAWGVNGGSQGFNIARDIAKPKKTD